MKQAGFVVVIIVFRDRVCGARADDKQRPKRTSLELLFLFAALKNGHKRAILNFVSSEKLDLL